MLLSSGVDKFLVLFENKTALPWVDWFSRQLQHPPGISALVFMILFALFSFFIDGVSLLSSIDAYV